MWYGANYYVYAFILLVLFEDFSDVNVVLSRFGGLQLVVGLLPVGSHLARILFTLGWRSVGAWLPHG